MEKIKGQAGKVGELLFAAETGAAYKKTITLTWAILRETGVLLWLIICLVFVGAEWFWKKSIVLGQSARTWYEGLKEPSEEEPKSATEMGQSALSALGTGTETLLYQAKKQLGIDAEPPAPKPQPPKIKAPPAPAPEPVKPTESAIAAAATQTQSDPTTPESISALDAENADIEDTEED